MAAIPAGALGEGFVLMMKADEGMCRTLLGGWERLGYGWGATRAGSGCAGCVSSGAGVGEKICVSSRSSLMPEVVGVPS